MLAFNIPQTNIMGAGFGGYEIRLQWTNRQLAGCQIYPPLGTTPLVRYRGELLNPATDIKVTLTLPPKTPNTGKKAQLDLTALRWLM
jgi:hypothetical protein